MKTPTYPDCTLGAWIEAFSSGCTFIFAMGIRLRYYIGKEYKLLELKFPPWGQEKIILFQ